MYIVSDSLKEVYSTISEEYAVRLADRSRVRSENPPCRALDEASGRRGFADDLEELRLAKTDPLP